VYSFSAFYDSRERQDVSVINIDMGNLRESGIAPTNGILYVSNEGAAGAIRIDNAAELPVSAHGGFAIASDDAVYVRGDFNTVNKKPVMVAADAVMVQSNAWDDSKSNSTDMNVRKATATEMNGVFLQGIVPSQEDAGVQYYSGGLENFFRFMENWTGTVFTFSGSMVCMWESQKWVGYWRDWPVSRPPDRSWSWDSTLAATGGPPGVPSVYEVVRRHWNIR
jgi:hypothetical protein